MYPRPSWYRQAGVAVAGAAVVALAGGIGYGITFPATATATATAPEPAPAVTVTEEVPVPGPTVTVTAEPVVKVEKAPGEVMAPPSCAKAIGVASEIIDDYHAMQHGFRYNWDFADTDLDWDLTAQINESLDEYEPLVEDCLAAR